MRVLFTIIVVALAFMMIGSECIFGTEEPTDDKKPLDRSSPGKTLEELAYVYSVTKDVEDYQRLLVGTSYAYYFDPNDVGTTLPGGYQIPVSWTYQEDVSATGNMFSQAYRIELTVNNWEDYTNVGEVTEYEANNVSIDLYLYPEDDTFAYWAHGYCDFEFKKVSGVWLITAWHDRTGS